MNIRRLIEIQATAAFRHRRNLPVHGQRTHTNARTPPGSTPRRSRRQETDQGKKAKTVFSNQF